MKKPMKKNVALTDCELAVILDALNRHKEGNRRILDEKLFMKPYLDDIEGYIDSAFDKVFKVFYKSVVDKGCGYGR